MAMAEKDVIQGCLWLQHLRVLRKTEPTLEALCEFGDHEQDAEEIVTGLRDERQWRARTAALAAARKEPTDV